MACTGQPKLVLVTYCKSRTQHRETSQFSTVSPPVQTDFLGSRWDWTAVFRLAFGSGLSPVSFGGTVNFRELRQRSEPIPLWSELLNERTRKRKVAPPALPGCTGLTGKFGRGVLCIVEELEAPLLSAIEPEDNSFAECGRLVLVSEFHPPLEIAKIRRGDILDHGPGRF